MTVDGIVTTVFAVLAIIEGAVLAWLATARPKIDVEWKNAAYGSEDIEPGVPGTELRIYNDGRAPAYDVIVEVDNYRQPAHTSQAVRAIRAERRLDAVPNPLVVLVPIYHWHWKHDNRVPRVALTPEDSALPSRITATVSWSTSRGRNQFRRHWKRWESPDLYF